MRWLLLSILLPLLSAENYSLTPKIVRQGGTLHLNAPSGAEWALLGKRKVPLYPAGNVKSGLMPIAITAKPGEYTLEFLDSHDAVVETASFLIANAHYPRQNVVLPTAIAELKSSPEERESVNGFRAEET